MSNATLNPATALNIKPSSVKAMQILMIIKLLLVAVFFVVFTVKDITLGSVGPEIIMYTGIAFAAMLIPIFYFINKRMLWPLRIALLIDLVAAIPASAFISVALSLVVLGLSFTKSAKNYFNA